MLLTLNVSATLSSSFSSQQIHDLQKKAQPVLTQLGFSSKEYLPGYGFVTALFDVHLLKEIQQTASLIKEQRPSVVVLIGIGGSNLGTIAILQALYGPAYDRSETAQWYFADTVDDAQTKHLISRLKEHAEKGEKIAILVVSKSGTTTETIANAALLYEVCKKQSIVCVVTDKNSPLWIMAEKNNFHRCVIPKEVGGRFSVFTSVGLLPLLLYGVDIDGLIHGAQQAYQAGIEHGINRNFSIYTASLLYLAYHEQKKNIHDCFVLDPILAGIGYWYRQLIGESLGKTSRTENKRVGMTPMVSIGSVDLHSVTQLYLGGPDDKVTTFIMGTRAIDMTHIPSNVFSQINPDLEAKSVHEIHDALSQGVIRAFNGEKRASMVVDIKHIDPSSIGYFMMMKMMEIVYLAYLLDVDPFDQPHVELYKQETKRILSK
jgi:glucose-6-phosphate isomerase